MGVDCYLDRILNMSIFRYGPFLIVMAVFTTVSWADEALLKVKPFLKQHCFECHGPKNQKGDIRFDTLVVIWQSTRLWRFGRGFSTS